MPTSAAKFALAVALSALFTLAQSLSAAMAGAAANHFASLRWTAFAPAAGAPTARSEAAAAVVGNRLYLIGGRGIRPLDIMDLAARRWTRGASPPFELNHFQAVPVGTRIYVAGALNGPFPQEHVVPQILIYDTVTNKWSMGPALPAGRARGAAATVVRGNFLYFLGGNRLGHNSGYVPWFDRLDLKTGRWIKLPDAPHARDHFQAVILDGKLYAPGGRKSASDRKQDVSLTIPQMDIYDLRTERWTTAAAPIPTPRAGLSAVTIDGLVVTMGGESATQKAAHAEVEAYDPANGRWLRLPPLPQGRHGTQAVLVGKAIQIVAGSSESRGGPELSDQWVLSGF
jgi:N-acetylneuraminic acid mutarotase